MRVREGGGGREGKIRLVICARFLFRLPECWQSQSNFSIQSKIHVISIFHLGDGYSIIPLFRASEESTEATQLLGYSELRENQAQFMTYLLSGRDVFASLPICSGKSLCYCLLRKPSTYFAVRVAGPRDSR